MKFTVKILIILCVIFSLGSCKTKTNATQKIALGMSIEQVVKALGRPYKTASRYDKARNVQDVLYYKEKTWDDGGWSWSTTTTNHILVFKNRILVAIDQGAEEHNKQTYNTHFVF